MLTVDFMSCFIFENYENAIHTPSACVDVICSSLRKKKMSKQQLNSDNDRAFLKFAFVNFNFNIMQMCKYAHVQRHAINHRCKRRLIICRKKGKWAMLFDWKAIPIFAYADQQRLIYELFYGHRVLSNHRFQIIIMIFYIPLGDVNKFSVVAMPKSNAFKFPECKAYALKLDLLHRWAHCQMHFSVRSFAI